MDRAASPSGVESNESLSASRLSFGEKHAGRLPRELNHSVCSQVRQYCFSLAQGQPHLPDKWIAPLRMQVSVHASGPRHSLLADSRTIRIQVWRSVLVLHACISMATFLW